MKEWLTVNEIAFELGVVFHWVTRRLGSNKAPYIQKLSYKNVLARHYHRDWIDKLKEMMVEFPPTPDYLPVEKIAARIHRPHVWVIEYARRLGIEERVKEIDGRSVLCFRSNAVAELPRSQFYSAYEDWLTMSAIMRRLNRSKDWVEARLKLIKAKPKMMPDFVGFMRPHYPPEVLDALESTASWYPPADDWVTLTQMARMLNVTKEDLHRSMLDAPIRFELRIDRGGNVRKHYPPETLDVARRCIFEWNHRPRHRRYSDTEKRINKKFRLYFKEDVLKVI